MQQNILPFGGELILIEDCFSREESNENFKKLQNEIIWRQEPIVLFGKQVMQPRLTAMYGEPGICYGYSGIIMPTHPWTETLRSILQKVKQVTDADFNIALLNQYRTGSDSMGWHRDNEKELGPEPIIASVSFGATRDFRVRPYKETGDTITIPLTSGSVLLMKGDIQTKWQHEVPKTKKPVGTRINITFRWVYH